LLPKGGKREIITGIAQWERAGQGWEHIYGIWGWWDPRENYLCRAQAVDSNCSCQVS
jgi:hypothetical protein